MNTASALPLFDSLSSPVRLDMFRLLMRAEPHGMVAGEIATALMLAPNNASFHLKNLQQAGLVTAMPEGRFLRYRARLATMLDLVAFLGAECCNGAPEQCDTSAAACCPPAATETF